MPIYEYRCPECCHRFEMLQRMGEGGEGLTCPRCGAGRVEKQFSTFAAAGGARDAATSCGAGACGTGGFT